MSGLPTLPGYVPRPPTSAGGRAARASLAATARAQRERRLSVAAAGAVIPVCYGRVRGAARVFVVARHANKLVVGCLWGVGPISANPTLYDASGAPLASTVEVSHRLGSPSQTAHPWLTAAIPGYADTLVATHAGAAVPLAYTVLRLPADVPPRFEAEWYGLAVYDQRTGTTAFSVNPALWLQDFLANPIYGMGRAVDYAGSIDAVEACAELVGGEPRRWGGLVIDRRARAADWVETLRTYAGCLVLHGPNGLRLVPDRPRAVSRAIGPGEIVGPLTMTRIARAQRPTVVRVRYTDITHTPWRDAEAVAYAPGVQAGTRAWRESVVPLPGIQSHAVAEREAVERLNAALLTDLTVSWLSTDESLADELGDVVSLTHPDGLAAQKLRLTGIELDSPGRWRIQAHAYDAAVYSDSVAAHPPVIATTLADPRTPPPPVTGLAVVEEIYQARTGLYASRLRASWDASEWPYTVGYRVEVLDGDTLVWRIETRAREAVTSTVQDLVRYTVRVAALAELVAGEPAETDIVAQGKYLPPGNVPHVSGHYAAGNVRLEWGAAIDIDIWRYEVRRVAVGGAWNEAVVVDRVDGLSLTVPGVPLGNWDFLVKALDSVGLYSPEAARVTVAVTLPQDVPQVTGQYVSPEVRLSWHASPTADVVAYEVRRAAVGGAWDTATPIDRINATTLTVRGTPLGSWDWLVRAIDSVGRVSANEARTTIAVVRPPNVSGFSGFEAGGEVRLFWNAVTGHGVENYEIRYGAVGVAWANAKLLNRVDTLRTSTRDVAAGTYDFLVVARSLDGFESTTPARIKITVTVDSGAFLVDTATFDSPTVSNMAEYALGRLDDQRRWVTENNVAWGTKFANALSTYTQPLASYGAVASSWQSEAYDFGMEVTGNWLGDLSAVALAGAVTTELQLSSNAADWQGFESLTAKRGARFARLRASGNASSVIHVEVPVAQVRVDAIPRTERGFVQTQASGGALVQLDGEYAAAQSIFIASEGAAPRTTVFDRVLVAPASGLVHSANSNWAGGTAYAFMRISTAARTILSDDYLEYDVFRASDAGGSGGFDITFTDGSRTYTPNQPSCALGTGGMYGLTPSAVPIGQWVARKIPLGAFAGRVANGWLVTLRVTAAGADPKVVYRNIRVTNGGGTTRQTIWSAGEPQGNTLNINHALTNIQTGPSNSFLAYQFDVAGNQVAGRASWTFNGI